jgi:uncharacterized protein YpbB
VIALTKELKESSDELVDVSMKTQHWIAHNFDAARSSDKYDKLLEGLTRSVAHFNTRLHDHFFVKLQDHYASLKGKSKVKRYLKEVKELAHIVSRKAKKIRQAAWRGVPLFQDDGKSFDEPQQHEEKKPKVNSAQETYALFQQELSIEKIASMRGLATSTIEGHLLEFIKSGEIAIEKFVEPEKIKVISEAVESTGLEKLSAIKATLGDNYSYHEIRAVLYSLKKDQRQ